MTESGPADYQYYLSDLYRYYFGVRYSYAMLLKQEDVPARFKAVIRQYLLSCVAAETTLESHLYYLRSGDPAYEVYQELDARIRLTAPVRHRDLFGREEILWKERIVKAEELAAVTPEEKQRQGYRLCELQIPRRRLREFSL